MEFGRPTILIIHRNGDTLLITPVIDLNTAKAAAKVDRIAAWNDGEGEEWRQNIPSSIAKAKRVATGMGSYAAIGISVYPYTTEAERLVSVTPIMSHMRMIKFEEELKIARHAGQVANTMMTAGCDAIGDGVPEHSVALATAARLNRKSGRIISSSLQRHRYVTYDTFSSDHGIGRYDYQNPSRNEQDYANR